MAFRANITAMAIGWPAMALAWTVMAMLWQSMAIHGNTMPPHGGISGGLVGGPRAHHDQFCGFKSHRVHARRDLFLHKTKLISGKSVS